ncbi:MAG: response regulator [SAR324 cluster bacterium]|nr:response regulator [SAR324 cluster bacterium]
MREIRKIIVIQQSRSTLEVLQSLNYKILEAKDGIEGIRKILRFHPDLVILKLELEHLNGLGIVKILEAFKIRIPCIFTSESDQNKARAFNFKNTIGFLLNTEIQEKLKQTITQGVEKFEWSYHDPDYQFRQREWADIMGESNRKRILIVDDQRLMRQFSLSTLDSVRDYELYNAENGLQAIMKALLVKPDLIISDIEMPEMDGLTMSQVLFIVGKPFPIIFLSARDDEKTIARARNLEGVIGYLVKDEIRDEEVFIQKIRDFVKMADTMKEASSASYLEGSLEKLAKTGTEKGILAPSSKTWISSSSRQEFHQNHANGLGGLWKRPE